MTDSLRVILEIGKKKRVVAGAMDWPGLDRWGTSEDGAIETMMSYRPRYAGVAERAGMAKAFAQAGDPEVVERVPGVGSTDFWGIAHAPSEIEREVLSSADLERRLDLLQRMLGVLRRRRGARLPRTPPWASRRRTEPRRDHRARPSRRARAVLGQSRGPDTRSTCPSPPTSLRHIGRRSSPRSAPTTPKASRPGPGRSSSSSVGWLTT